MEKIPNWLRYILAIPFGIVCLVIGYYIGYIGNRWVASPDSLMMITYNFLYANGINVIMMMYGMNTMLPKYKFRFTLVVSIILFCLGIISLRLTIFMNTITVKYVIGLFLTFLAIIFSCYYTYQQEEIEK